MPDERLNRILTAISAAGIFGDSLSPARLCGVCPPLTGVTGAGIMLMAGEHPRGSLCASDTVSKLIEDLQFTLGEGPCVDAYRHDQVVTEPDLAGPAARRWAAFTPPVVRAGARAVFGFPLRVGNARLGALNLYRDRPGPLTGEQHADALMMAGVSARWVLDAQAGAAPDVIAAELELGADFHFTVHNAAGIVSVQEQVSITEALILLRAHAFSSDRPLNDVADDVIAHRIRLR